jgi:hypothetical protein
MPKQIPSIHLAGYQRLKDLERRIWYSPLSLAVYAIGLAGAAYGFWNLRGGVAAIGPGVLVGHGVFIGSYALLWAYFYGYRFRRLKCPGCGEVMQPFLADFEEGPWRRFILAIEIGGRYYRRPYGEDDRRSWIRLMKHVRACPCCKTYVDCSRMHQQTCTEAELAQLYQRLPLRSARCK